MAPQTQTVPRRRKDGTEEGSITHAQRYMPRPMSHGPQTGCFCVPLRTVMTPFFNWHFGSQSGHTTWPTRGGRILLLYSKAQSLLHPGSRSWIWTFSTRLNEHPTGHHQFGIGFASSFFRVFHKFNFFGGLCNLGLPLTCLKKVSLGVVGWAWHPLVCLV